MKVMHSFLTFYKWFLNIEIHPKPSVFVFNTSYKNISICLLWPKLEIPIPFFSKGTHFYSNHKIFRVAFKFLTKCNWQWNKRIYTWVNRNISTSIRYFSKKISSILFFFWKMAEWNAYKCIGFFLQFYRSKP